MNRRAFVRRLLAGAAAAQLLGVDLFDIRRRALEDERGLAGSWATLSTESEHWTIVQIDDGSGWRDLATLPPGVNSYRVPIYEDRGTDVRTRWRGSQVDLMRLSLR